MFWAIDLISQIISFTIDTQVTGFLVNSFQVILKNNDQNSRDIKCVMVNQRKLRKKTHF